MRSLAAVYGGRKGVVQAKLPREHVFHHMHRMLKIVMVGITIEHI